jgi:hypothetical protein
MNARAEPQESAMAEEVLAQVKSSTPRRWLGVGTLAFLAGLMIYVALAAPPAPGWQLFLLALGGLVLWIAEKMRRATERVLELTETALRDSAGYELARIDDIRSVDRGFFAFKPSNGFLVTTRTRGPRHWAPGLWWRSGRRIGVGGVTAAAQTKFMAEILAAMLAQRALDEAGDA